MSKAKLFPKTSPLHKRVRELVKENSKYYAVLLPNTVSFFGEDKLEMAREVKDHREELTYVLFDPPLPCPAGIELKEFSNENQD